MKNKQSIIWLDRTDSTNNEAKRHISDLDNLSVIAAVHQTAGRGQRGNVWKSAEGQNLTFSMILKFAKKNGTETEGKRLPRLAVKDQFSISEMTTVSITEYLASAGINAKIKWPNDIYVGDKKICGILIENTVSDDDVDSSIVGIGLNMNQVSFPAGLMNPVSMTNITHCTYDIRDSLVKLLHTIMNNLKNLADETGRNGLLEKYKSSMYGINENRHYRDCLKGYEFEGKIKGISDDALLIVEMPDGTSNKYAFKEISYII
ncbi:MAG: biotin--[acetyl-CoA-carboxylase] ligase [Bacteroidales bacterium]|jgi:BirA family biotin operon repressor/biotin-[acetyl-CoA-carboxylase] ligase|nr:biotin--[acetyl-CoA-carboxylase] ligase [Bacteroidales bacterium]